MSILNAEARKFPTHTQVLVIGAGACGTIAALAAKEHGAEVFIVERDAKPSGSTSLSSGQIPAGGTKLQRAAGLLDDTPDLRDPIAATGTSPGTSRLPSAPGGLALGRGAPTRDRRGLSAHSAVADARSRVPRGRWRTGRPRNRIGSGNLRTRPAAH